MTTFKKTSIWAIKIIVSSFCLLYIISQVNIQDRKIVRLKTKTEIFDNCAIVSEDEKYVTVQHKFLTRKIEKSEIDEIKFVATAKGLRTISRNLNWGYYLAGILFWIMPFILDTFRWFILLKSNHIIITIKNLFTLSFIGLFSNQVMLGTVGGDVIKGYLLAKRNPKKTEAVVSILSDRLIGLWALLLLGSVSHLITLLQKNFIKEGILGPIFLATFTLGCLFYFNQYFGISNLLKKANKLLPDWIKALDEVLNLCWKRKNVIMQCVFISLVAHSITITQLYFYGKALDLSVGLFTCFVLLPIVFTLASAPIAVAGLGVAEVSFYMLFSPYGITMTEVVTWSFIGRFTNIFLSLPGGLMWMIRK